MDLDLWWSVASLQVGWHSVLAAMNMCRRMLAVVG